MLNLGKARRYKGISGVPVQSYQYRQATINHPLLGERLGNAPQYFGVPGIFATQSTRIGNAARLLNGNQRRSVANLIARIIRDEQNTSFKAPTGRTKRETRAEWRGDVIGVASSPYAQWIKWYKEHSPPWPAPNDFVRRGWQDAQPAAVQLITEYFLLNSPVVQQTYGTGAITKLSKGQRSSLTAAARSVLRSTPRGEKLLDRIQGDALKRSARGGVRGLRAGEAQRIAEIDFIFG